MKTLSTYDTFADAVSAADGPLDVLAIVRSPDGKYVLVKGAAPATIGPLVRTLRSDLAPLGPGEDPGPADLLLAALREAAS